MCGVSPSWVSCETTFALIRCMKPRPLLPIAVTWTFVPARSSSRRRCVTIRSTLVFRPPHRPLVGGHEDHAGRLHRVPAHQERVPVLGVGVGQVRGDVAHLVGVGTGVPHPVLRLAHLGRGDHLHRLGDLARVLHALDLVADLSRASHGSPCPSLLRRGKRFGDVGQYAPVFLEGVDRALQRVSSSFERSLVFETLSTQPACLSRMNACSADSKDSTFSTGTSSR